MTWIVLPGTRIFDFRVSPIDLETQQPDRTKTMTLFRAPEFICEPHPEHPKQPRSKLRFFAPTCNIWYQVLRGLCPTFGLVPDPDYRGTGTPPWIWTPVHRQQVKKVQVLQGNMMPSNEVEWFESPIISKDDVVRIHGKNAVSGGLGISPDGSIGRWMPYQRPPDKIQRRLVSGPYDRPQYEAPPKELPPEVPNGLVIRAAILSAHAEHYLPKADAEGRPIFTPEDFPDLERACSPDPAVNPLLGLPVEWRVRLVKYAMDDDEMVMPTQNTRKQAPNYTDPALKQQDDLGRNVRFV